MSLRNISRRQVLQGLGAMGTLPFLPGCESGSDMALLPASVQTNVPLLFPQPEVRNGGNAAQFDTTLATRFASHQVADRTALLRTYEGTIGGPTLRTRPGQTLRVRLLNQFPLDTRFPKTGNENTPHEFNTTNLHTHGLHVSPSGNSDNIFLEIQPQSEFQYEFRIPDNHPGGTFFYHPHKHGSAAMQMFSGMAGALILEGELDRVPEVAAARDLIYLIAELNLDPTTGQVPDFTGDVFPKSQRIITVNGRVRPRLTAVSGEVFRLRIINATVRTSVPLAIDGHQLGVLSFDGITLPALKTQEDVDLAVAMRADVLVRAGAPGTYAIKKKLDTGGQEPDPEVVLGFLDVVPGNVQMGLPTSLPAPDSLPDIQTAEIVNRRTLVLDRLTGPDRPLPMEDIFTIDGRLFDSNRVDQAVALGAVEEWTFLNNSDDMHPFHLHTNPFQVISMNGMALSRPEWHDTMHVPKRQGNTPGSMVMRVRFRDFTGRTVVHCHNLMHEDTGMMQVVEIS